MTARKLDQGLIDVGLNSESLAIDGHGDRTPPQGPSFDLRLLGLRDCLALGHRLPAHRRWRERGRERLSGEALKLKRAASILSEPVGQTGSDSRRHDIGRPGELELPDDQGDRRLRQQFMAGFWKVSEHE